MTQPKRTSPTPLFLASGALIVLALPLLILGLVLSSLVLVYASIACLIAWLPIGVVGVVILVRGRGPARV